MTTQYKKIMVPLDGSEFSATALPHAQALAERFDAELLLFQVIQEPMGYVAGGETGVVTTVAVGPAGEEIARQTEATKRGLEQIGTRLRKEGVAVRTATQVGNAAEAIVDTAEDEKIDLIVMSSHGRSGLARWAFGSVAAKVTQAATCPVMTIRPKPR